MKKRELLFWLLCIFAMSEKSSLLAQNKIIGLSESGPIDSDFSGGMIWKCSSDGSAFEPIIKFEAIREGVQSSNMVWSGGHLFGFFMYEEAGCQQLFFSKLSVNPWKLEVLNRFDYSDISCSFTLLPFCFKGQDGAFYGALKIDSQTRCFKITADGSQLKWLAFFDKPINGMTQTANGDIAVELYSDEIVVFNSNSGTQTASKTIASAIGSFYETSGLVSTSDGWIFGVLTVGQTDKMFKIKEDGSSFFIFQQTNVSDPSSIVFDSDQFIYGTSGLGDPERIFKFDIETGEQTWLYSNLDVGLFDHNQISLDTAGNLFFMTFGVQNRLFRAKTDGSQFLKIADLPFESPWTRPVGAMIWAPDGGILGFRKSSGSVLNGDVFSIKKDGTGYANVYKFNRGNPLGQVPTSIKKSSDGRFFSSMRQGGPKGKGAVFSMNADGSDYKILFDERAEQLFEGSDGFIYGTWAGKIFRIKKDGSQSSKIFQSPNSVGYQNLIEADDGKLYLHDDCKITSMNKDGSQVFALPYEPCKNWGYPTGWLQGAGFLPLSGGRLYCSLGYFNPSIPSVFFTTDILSLDGTVLKSSWISPANWNIPSASELFGPGGHIFWMNKKITLPSLTESTITSNGCEQPISLGRTLRFLNAESVFIGERSEDEKWDLFKWNPTTKKCEFLLFWNDGLGFDGRPQFETQAVSTTFDEDGLAKTSLTPNPVESVLTVEWSNLKIEKGQLEIVSTVGQTLRKMPISDGSTGIDAQVGDLPEGIYFVQIRSKGRLLKALKFVKL